MRILHFDAGREMRGGQWQVLRLIEGLSSAGVESGLLARLDAPLFQAARKQGLRVEPLSVGRALTNARRWDLLHAHDARSHTMGALVPGIPLVVSRRVAFTATDRPSPLWRWKYGRPVRFLAVSEHVKSMLMRNGVPEKRISVVHDGVPLLEVSRQPGSREPSPESGVLAPGNAGDPQKGLAVGVFKVTPIGGDADRAVTIQRVFAAVRLHVDASGIRAWRVVLSG